jgi:ABC-type transporter MlaC component
MSKILLLLLIFSFSPIHTDPVATIKKMVGFIRYEKNEKAIGYIDVEHFSKNLLKEEYDKLTDAQKLEFQNTMKNYIIKKSFPIAQNYFSKVDLTYEKPKKQGNYTFVPASLLYKGDQKISFAWQLHEKNGEFMVTDFQSEGKLISDVNREKQILPFLKENGFDKLIKKIQDVSK